MLPSLVKAQRPNDAAISFSPAPYQVGERLTYNVSFSSFATAAHVELLVASRSKFFDREGIELRAHVETVEVVSAALYSINTDFISYVDPNTGLPFRTQQVAREGTQVRDTSHNVSQPTASSTSNTAGGAFATYDLLSALYRLRAMPLAQGSTYRLSVLSGSSQFEAEIKVTGREAIKSNIGSFNTLVTRVRVKGNERADDYRVRIYFSDDERHIPVRVTASHPAGEIRADLASSEFINGPLPTMVAPATPSPTPTPTPKQPVAVSSPSARPLPNQPFSAGEQLNFNFFLGNMPQPVGTATYQVRPRDKYFGREGLLLMATFQTSPAGQRLFPVNDQINSYVNATTLLPFRTELRLQEGRRKVNRTVTVVQENGSAVMDDGTSIDIPVGTHDLVSVLYALRSFDLNPPKRNAVALLVNKRPRTLFITSLKRETIELNGQRIPAVQLSLATNEPQGDRQALRLWVSADRRRLPLRLTAQTPLGPLRADLAIIPVNYQ